MTPRPACSPRLTARRGRHCATRCFIVRSTGSVTGVTEDVSTPGSKKRCFGMAGSDGNFISDGLPANYEACVLCPLQKNRVQTGSKPCPNRGQTVPLLYPKRSLFNPISIPIRTPAVPGLTLNRQRAAKLNPCVDHSSAAQRRALSFIRARCAGARLLAQHHRRKGRFCDERKVRWTDFSIFRRCALWQDGQGAKPRTRENCGMVGTGRCGCASRARGFAIGAVASAKPQACPAPIGVQRRLRFRDKYCVDRTSA